MTLSHKKLLLASVAIMSLGLVMPIAAETVTEKTVVTQQPIPNVVETNFSAFDLNHDNILSMREVGDKLFYIFDTDGNEVIDNIEFGKNRVLTIIPMEKESFTYVDLNDDGLAEAVSYDRDTFIQQSRLARFDKDMDGLSAHEFIDEDFLAVDDDRNGSIDPEEWREEYLAVVRHKVDEPERYQD